MPYLNLQEILQALLKKGNIHLELITALIINTRIWLHLNPFDNLDEGWTDLGMVRHA